MFNTDLIQVLELGAMLQVAEAIAHSAAQRKELRGSHQRLDHPERDDGNYLKHSLATYRGAEPPAIELLRRGDHPLATGRAGLWGSRGMSEDRHARDPALPAGDRRRAAFPELHRSLPGRLGRARRAQPHQGPSGRHPVVSLVLPHGDLRQLRHDDQRRTQARLSRLPARLPPWRDPDRAARPFPDRTRSGDRHGQLHGEAFQREALCDREGEQAARARAKICRPRCS